MPVVTGRDGKTYPAWRLSRADRVRAIRLAHSLCHGDRLSVRAAQEQTARSGVRRSRGAIANDLARFTCEVCKDWP